MVKISLLLALLAIFYIASRPDKLPMAELAVYSNNGYGEYLKSVGGPCAEDKCLTIYVSPWCGTCRALNPMIVAMVQELQSEGVTATVIIGNDKLSAIEKYAEKYPFPVFFDSNGDYYSMANVEGVPYFAVTNQAGEIIDYYRGGYREVARMRSELKI